MSPPRCAVVWCTDWPVTAAVLAGTAGRGPQFDPSAPLAVVHARRVQACSAAASRDGVRVGQTRRDAQGACPHLVLVPHDADRDARFFEPVVRAIGELVPLLDVETPGRLLMATRGPSRYVGGDERLAERLIDLAVGAIEQASGVAAIGVGIADGRVAAMLAARRSIATGRPIVVPSSSTAEFLAPHPVSVLVPTIGADSDIVDLLRRLGLETFGHVAQLTSAQLSDRFGRWGDGLYRVVTGLDDTPPAAVPPPDDLSVSRVFDDPIGQIDQVVFAAKVLADTIEESLSDRGLVCTRLVVDAESEHGERSSRGWVHADGLASAAIVDRVRWQLVGWIDGDDPPSAGITSLSIVPTDVRHDSAQQRGFWGERTQADDTAARAMTRLVGLLGPDAVTLASWRGGRHPHDQFELVPFASLGADDRRLIPRPIASSPWPGALPAPAPSVVHIEPRPIDVVDGDGRAVAVNGRGLVSAPPACVRIGRDERRVVAWAGPWPFEEKWWTSQRRRAARFQFVLGGERGPDAYMVWLENGRWSIVGEYR
ncbi:MAG: DNA polymerase Y family protein [Ilumatobacteraceae bacterium]